jgi:hypothetical protein
MQRVMRSFLALVILTSTSGLYAAHLYRYRLPFVVQMTSQDVVEASYNYAGKLGVICTANKAKVQLSFSYKGYTRTATLPVILLADRIPNNAIEQLADVKGRFSLIPQAAKNDKHPIQIACDYYHG